MKIMTRLRPITDVQYNNVNFKSVEKKVFQTSLPHIAMQGCLNGTIIRELSR